MSDGMEPGFELAPVEPTPPGVPGMLAERGWLPPDGLGYEDWAVLLASFGQMARSHPWWIGDAIRFGEVAYGQKYKQALEATKLSYHTLRKYVSVASRYQLCLRRHNLDFWHYYTVAGLEPEIRAEWLDWAEEEQAKLAEIGGEFGYRELKKAVALSERTSVLPWQQQAQLVLPPSPTAEILDGDFREVLTDRYDGSIDVIITDPPYPLEYLSLYGDLAILAARVLKPGGLLICMAGQSDLPELMQLMEPHLEYRWMCSYLTPGPATRIWDRKMLSGWKPILLYTNGDDAQSTWAYDVAKSLDSDKDFHEWGQSESGIGELVERFTNTGDLILDPFLGGGTTGVVAVDHGRRFVGCDTDPNALTLARGRLARMLA